MPTQFPFTFDAPSLVSEKCRFGSVFTLKQQLEHLQEQSAPRLQKQKQLPSAETPRLLKRRLLRRLFVSKTKEQEPEKLRLADAAEVGLTIFLELATKASKYRLLMLLHF